MHNASSLHQIYKPPPGRLQDSQNSPDQSSLMHVYTIKKRDFNNAELLIQRKQLLNRREEKKEFFSKKTKTHNKGNV